MTGPRYALSTVATVRSYSPQRGIRSAEQQTKTPGASRSAMAFTRRSCSACLNDQRKQMAMAPTPLPTSVRMAASASSSLSSTTTSPLQSTRSLTSAMSGLGTMGSGLPLSGKCSTWTLLRPGTPRAPRMMWMTSRWPLVVISPTLAPRRCSMALVPTVVPSASRAVSRSSASVVSPTRSAASRSDSITPSEKSSGVDAALAVTMRPSASITTQSVKVPPVSMPMMYAMLTPGRRVYRYPARGSVAYCSHCPHGPIARRRHRPPQDARASSRPHRGRLAARAVGPAGLAGLAGRAADAADPDRGAGRRGPVVGGELDVPGRPQADRAVLPGERRAEQAAGRHVAAVRSALPRALHRHHHARAAGRAGPGGRRRQPGGPDVLALAADVAPARAVPAGLERGWHVPDHRCHVPRGPALLHPCAHGGRGRPVARRALVLVQWSLHPHRAEPCRRADCRPPGSRRRPGARAPAHRRRHARAEAGSRRRHPPLRRRTRRRLRPPPLPADPGPALRRPRRQPLPVPRQHHEELLLAVEWTCRNLEKRPA